MPPSRDLDPEALYQGADELPPPEIDAAILAAAQRSGEQRGRWWSGPRAALAGLAAVLVVAVSLVLPTTPTAPTVNSPELPRVSLRSVSPPAALDNLAMSAPVEAEAAKTAEVMAEEADAAPVASVASVSPEAETIAEVGLAAYDAPAGGSAPAAPAVTAAARRMEAAAPVPQRESTIEEVGVSGGRGDQPPWCAALRSKASPEAGAPAQACYVSAGADSARVLVLRSPGCADYVPVDDEQIEQRHESWVLIRQTVALEFICRDGTWSQRRFEAEM